MKKFITVLGAMLGMIFISLSSSLAHCIWTEVPFKVEPGQEFTVSAYYAHPDYPLEERDKTSLSLVVLKPGEEMQEIVLFENPYHYDNEVSLNSPGQHFFVLERSPNRYRLSEIRDFGKSMTWVGEAGSLVHDPVGIPLEIITVKVNELANGHKELTVQVLFKGSPVSGGAIEVFQSLENDSILYDEIAEYDVPKGGKVTFTIDPSRKYVLETDHRVPAREIAGTGFAITEVRFRSTLFIGAM
ncbi:DUF4198 domain-containing protein [Desulfonatronovibrio hydrogenovorans]|uniref:DUF4198 domain-containing protein n=1 Tax=Desulfonatronovibrio hydrogenovorans TaxID=53245 RepID=UPI00049096FD|nr:DUF4198 domain-containing protein [Desulfonatronovibrio hydrogenovorans]